MRKATIILSLFLVLAAVLWGCNSRTNTTLDPNTGDTGQMITPVPFNQVKLEDNFWLPRLNTQKKTLVPFALDKTRPAVENLSKAAQFLAGDSTDLPFPHRYISSDLYKVMEGAALILRENPDPKLEKRMDSIIDIIAKAQKEDGYLYVAHITGVSKDASHWGGAGMGDKPYSWVLHSHELYNMGHMYEAAIAYYQSTGKVKWLKVVEKNARHINKVFFEGDPNYNNGEPILQAPGHEELELALVKLYRVTGEKLYLDMSKKFLDIRGKTYKPEGNGVMDPTYSQQHKPVAEQDKAVGHAVRAAYLYSAMADVASLTNTNEYNNALNNIWHDITDTKMHITGGLGAIHGIEGFGPAYVLPNKEAYNETCAAVGNVFFNYRMFLLTKEARFMDVAEIALFNNSLAGVNIEGNKFFYVNPLEADGETPFNHGKAGRSPWFGTACCPSNIARLIPQVSGMMYSYNDNEIYTTFYASSSSIIPLKEGAVAIQQKSGYPYDEKIELLLTPKKAQRFVLKLRIPTWTGDQFVPGKLYSYVNDNKKDWQLKVNGEAVSVAFEKGFAIIDRSWEPGDKVELTLPMPVRFNTAIEMVEADKGRVAVTKGPLVYCAEGVDNEQPVQHFLIDDLGQNKVIDQRISDGILKNVTSVSLNGKIRDAKGTREKQIKMIPYYAWNNRGDSSMRVWFPTRTEMVQYKDGQTLKGGKYKSVRAFSIAQKGSLEAISDGLRPMSSNDKSIPSWISDSNSNEQWVEIDLDPSKQIRSINVYWFDNGDTVKIPSQWSLEYLVNDKWKEFDLYVTDSYSLKKDEYNVVHPAEVLKCNSIRINMKLRDKAASGILDVDVQYENIGS
ncbi:glycoside hydrolase family 127 protein [Maribacter sp. MMG018]|uniref:glycoside hydrolase family 127 protein n=1 Tax=Maribacter sp. MMG018 TaxID=2822688 RepID=UPI001B3726D1|nr:beta-L-arabinofuranosidase domain-containing protein [Maribacter sp. MMG018]MBQ4913799.1 glycoside hydrolase family 127 protein [Maribacter sp. MMG018]